MRWLGGKSDLDGQESRLRKHATARRRPGTVRSTDLPTGSLALAPERRRPPSSSTRPQPSPRWPKGGKHRVPELVQTEVLALTDALARATAGYVER